MSIEDKIIKWKRQLEEDKSERSKLEGQMESIMKRIKEEHNCNSIEELEKELDKLQNNLNRLTERRDKLVAEYEEKYFGD